MSQKETPQHMSNMTAATVTTTGKMKTLTSQVKSADMVMSCYRRCH